MPSAPQSPLTGLTVMPQQAAGQQQDSQAAQAAAAQAAAQYQVYEPQLQFAQSKSIFEHMASLFTHYVLCSTHPTR